MELAIVRDFLNQHHQEPERRAIALDALIQFADNPYFIWLLNGNLYQKWVAEHEARCIEAVGAGDFEKARHHHLSMSLALDLLRDLRNLRNLAQQERIPDE